MEGISEADAELCNDMYKLFSSLVDELTAICVDSQQTLDGYKKNLQDKVIPNMLIDDFVDQRRRILSDLTVKAERARSIFPIIDYVEEALEEIEQSVTKLEAQCAVAFKACQDRRPKKGFSLFNKKELSGTDVDPPTWTHPDYIFNVDNIVTKLKQVRDISEAGMKNRIDEIN